MTVAAEPFVEIWRGPILESVHFGHAVLCGPDGDIIQSWGDPGAVILPRSSIKMIQALPLLMTGAADAFRLTNRQLALACASHKGAPMHIAAVNAWLSDLGLGDDDLICGPQASRDKALRHEMIRDGQTPCRVHNNCSGKHSGFLTTCQHLQCGLDYVALDHPVQKHVLEAYETLTDQTSPGYGIDGCSAPNFAATIAGVARAMAWFATAHQSSGVMANAAARLVTAMRTHPEMVSGDDGACTQIMRAATEPLAVKTGAEGVFVAILPDRGMGLALKIADGATRASEAAVAAILVSLGALDPQHPDIKRYLTPDITNWDGLVTGKIRPSKGLMGTRATT